MLPACVGITIAPKKVINCFFIRGVYLVLILLTAEHHSNLVGAVSFWSLFVFQRHLGQK
jgi:hypothetical protein